ncbi:NAD-dependent epimerase/dehydratase family protein [Anthocerotibacter panamensis]|uniref:NAD-dependent epimerase/dehydratase family protein n=1 Tax=Anthocerotibacter panamensis TaxID=2857077 RepID=UPI001C4031C8|nr:NAD-dependent epimerase/dehydratase family protein [Anthocerotibacter panamensis]
MSLTSLVTGCAGFIGSHLTEYLLAQGHRVIGIDCFTDYYSRALKRNNLLEILKHPQFHLLEEDICHVPWPTVLDGVDFLFHQAAQAGVRSSWGTSFHHYTYNNIEATQILLEAARNAPGLLRFIFASTSSIYGEAEAFPTPESVTPRPVSPYGITKLAAERLGQLYYHVYGVPFVALRYFSVYGPRQRPDMGFHKFIQAILAGRKIEVYGDGYQSRDFTYVADIVTANLQAAFTPNPVEGEVINIGGGSRVVLNDALDLMGQLTGCPIHRVHSHRQAGDALHTSADISKAKALLAYHPQYDLAHGLQAEITWLQETLSLVQP